jgi:serine/threonine-protein kinase SRPK3
MSIFGRSWRPLFSRAWKPLVFPSEGFVAIPADRRVEEETLPDYAASHYYPVQIGEILCARYQVVGKLGFGVTSTVWLARDLR